MLALLAVCLANNCTEWQLTMPQISEGDASLVLTFTMASLVWAMSEMTPSVMMRSTKYWEPSCTAAAYLQAQNRNEINKARKTYTRWIIFQTKESNLSSLIYILLHSTPTLECWIIVWIWSIKKKQYHSLQTVSPDWFSDKSSSVLGRWLIICLKTRRPGTTHSHKILKFCKIYKPPSEGGQHRRLHVCSG